MARKDSQLITLAGQNFNEDELVPWEIAIDVGGFYFARAESLGCKQPPALIVGDEPEEEPAKSRFFAVMGRYHKHFADMEAREIDRLMPEVEAALDDLGLKPTQSYRRQNDQLMSELEARNDARLADLADLLARAPAGAKVIYIDTETTGLAWDDELLEVAIIDDSGRVLLDSLIRPRHKPKWPAAQAIHGIVPEDVAKSPWLSDLVPHIAAICREADAVVIYNATFDLGYLPAELFAIIEPKCVCAMRTYAMHAGVWDGRRHSYKWHKLGVAAKRAGHTWTGSGHRALADAQALRTVWQWLRVVQSEQGD